MKNKPIRIVIVGGGAVGVFAAAALKHNVPDVSVVMVHDPKTPYIGVGESLGWNGRDFFKNMLGFKDDSEWLAESQSTLKLAVAHRGFDGTSTPLFSTYFWNPSAKVITASVCDSYRKQWGDTSTRPPGASATGDLDDELTLSDVWMHLYRKGLRKAETRVADLSEMYWYAHYNTMPEREHYAHQRFASSFHINADHIKDVVYEKKCVPAGVETIEKKIANIKTDQGRITSIVCDDGTEITGDLFIDSTGFKRVLANAMNFKWQPAGDTFNNSALVGNAPHADNHYAPSISVTEHYAMEKGWLFGIPMPNRTGMGYVFNTNITSNEDTIRDEFDQQFPERAGALARRLKWEPGYFENTFVGNCIALGISGGFLDAYDANNFSTTLSFITKIVECLQDDGREFNWHAKYNNYVNGINNDVMFRVKTGMWLAKKNDTIYWQALKQAAIDDHMPEKWLEAIHNPARRHARANQDLFWFQGVNMSHSMYNGLDPSRTCNIDEQFEQLAINYFDFFSRKNQLQAQHAQSAKDFYTKLYEKNHR